MRKIVIWNLGVLSLSFMISSCLIKKQNDNGFTVQYNSPNKNLSALQSVYIEKEVELSGWFVNIIHYNGRSLSIFLPSINSRRINLRKLILKIEETNNPNNWGFYYSIFGAFEIDSISSKGGKKIFYNSNETIYEQIFPFSLKTKKFRSYRIEYFYKSSVKFCLAKVDISVLNQYNLNKRIEDGPNKISNNVPFFLFSENDKIMEILLCKSEYCN